MKFRLAARSSEVGFRGPLIFQILFWPPGSKVFRKASLSLVNKHVSVLEKSALSNSLPYFVSFGYMSERLIPDTRRKDNRYYYTSDSLWKIWLVESVQSIHNSLWTWHDKCNICCRYCIYHVKFNVCLVTKPLGVFSKVLNSVFAWYHELSKPRVCIILIIHDIMLNLLQ